MELTILDKIVIVLGAIVLVASQFYFDSSADIQRVNRLSVTSDLHQITSAGQQYIIKENVDSVSYTSLVAKEYLQPMSDERYEHTIIHKDGGAVRVQTDWGTVTYTY